MSQSRPIGKGSFRSRMAPSLPGSPGVTTRRRKTTKSLAVPNLSWPVPPRTGCSLWSRTQKNTPRPAAGGSLILTTASPPTRWCTTPASLATRLSKIATWSSPVTHLDSESQRMPSAYDRRGEIMVNVTYNQQLTALLVIDPYNDFISEGGWEGLPDSSQPNRQHNSCSAERREITW